MTPTPDSDSSGARPEDRPGDGPVGTGDSPEDTEARIAPGDDRRVLIVDDDEDLAESLADLLIARGYEVEIAKSARQAVEIGQHFDLQVALLDIRLGRDSGLDVIGMLKNQHPEVVCIMATGYAETETAITALRLGAYDYLRKPLHPSEVFAVLDRSFEKIRLGQKARAAFQALRAAKESAESADRTKTEFLAAMSHELRTPLHSIIGFAEVLISQAFGELGDERYVDYAGNIRESGMHLLEIINDILEIAKAEAGKLDLREGLIGVADVIGTAVRLIGPQAEAGKLELETAVAPDVPALYGDEQKLKQILLNLLSNAVKVTPKGGKVTVEAGQDEHEGGIVITVRDTGIGIAPEDIPKALAPFSQVDSELSRGYPGTGLGLSLSAIMAELHGGTLTLESEVAKGTTAPLRFPAERSFQNTDAA
jgi:signal transduction histidine kinase